MTIAPTPTITAGAWTSEPTHSELSFSVRHLGLSKVRGRFNDFRADVSIGETFTDSSVSAEIDLGSVDTGNPDRDGHLRSPDFFDVDSDPKLVFRSTSIEDDGDGTGRLVGELSSEGASTEVVLDVEFHGVGADPYGMTRAGFSATGTISRKELGIDFNVPLDAGQILIGDKVAIELEIQLVPAE